MMSKDDSQIRNVCASGPSLYVVLTRELRALGLSLHDRVRVRVDGRKRIVIEGVSE